MDMHVHSTVSSDIVVLKRSTVVHEDVANSTFNNQSLFLMDTRQNESSPIYHPQKKYFNPYLSYLDLRGPPTSGNRNGTKTAIPNRRSG